jgi:dephospho-CoA kinase
MSRKMKLLIAITGGIGSGKTTFANFLVEQGYPVLYADDISKEILANDPDVKNEIAKEFGAGAYFGEKINKKFIADNIFSNPIKLKKINSILHPRVRKRIESLSKEYFKKSNIVFVEAAIIYESKIEKMYDFVVLIVADEKLRKKRVIKNNKISAKDFIYRGKNQLDDEVKIKKADFVFINNGTEGELKQKAILLSTLLKATY